VGLSDIADCLEPLVLRPDDVLLRTVFEALGQLLGEYRFIWIPLLTKTWFASISSRRCKRSPIWRAMSEGCTGFNFLQGGHEYKQKFCTGRLELMDAFICQRSLAGRLNHWLSRLVRRLRGAPKPQHQPRDEKQQHRAQLERPHQKVHGHSRVVFKLQHIVSCNPEELGVKADDKLIRNHHRQKPQQEEPKRHQKTPETKLLRRPTALI
jgi:hypothetical protein